MKKLMETKRCQLLLSCVTRSPSSTLLLGMIGLLLSATPVSAQTLTTLVNFDNLNGTGPGSLVPGIDGSYYGTTASGGMSGNGTLFLFSPNGAFTVLANLTTGTSSRPNDWVLGSDSNFYGTTTDQYGRVVRMAPDGTFTNLVQFTGANGLAPNGRLVEGSDGYFYGTTAEGGRSIDCGFPVGCGTVFKMTSSGTVTTLASFDPHDNGAYPSPFLAQDGDGNFYGSTVTGGADPTVCFIDGYIPRWGCGTIFKITPSGSFTTLVNFTEAEGIGPGNVVKGIDGNFYGTTSSGGSNTNCPSGCGTLFKISPDGALTILANLTTNTRPNDWVEGSDGNFYSTYGDTVVRMTLAGTFTNLINFNPSNGTSPTFPMLQGSDGNFYGTTVYGGSSGGGTVFSLNVAIPGRLKLNPSSVVGGEHSKAYLLLTTPAPAGGAVVTLRSNYPGVASVPSTVTVPAGKKLASFLVITSPVITSTIVKITTSYGLATKSKPLTVNPGQAAP